MATALFYFGADIVALTAVLLVTEADLYGTREHREACSERLAKLRNDGIFTPPSVRGTLVHPATGGGVIAWALPRPARSASTSE
jgi:quinoprotein glucose dehydrogenase